MILTIKKSIRTMVAIAIILTTFPGCGDGGNGDNNPADFEISKIDYREKTVDITEQKTFRGFALGCNFDRNEVFIKNTDRLSKKINVRITDIDTGTVKKQTELSYGNFNSPVDFFNINRIEYLNGRYYIVDQLHKYVVYDEQFNRLYTSNFGFNMHARSRRFMDFFITGEKVSFVYCHNTTYRTYRTESIVLYDAPFNRRPEIIAELSRFSLKIIPWETRMKTNHKYIYFGKLWASTTGFEKDGKVFYSSMNDNHVYAYDTKSKKTTTTRLNYLKPRRFTDKQADKFHRPLDPDSDADKYYKEKMNMELLYVAYLGDIYHFGIYDLGKDKIGIVGELDLTNLKFRMDVLNPYSHRYLFSMWLPVNYGFRNMISDETRGTLSLFLNLDKGSYIFHGLIEEEDKRIAAKLSRIKLTDSNSRTQ